MSQKDKQAIRAVEAAITLVIATAIKHGRCAAGTPTDAATCYSDAKALLAEAKKDGLDFEALRDAP